MEPPSALKEMNDLSVQDASSIFNPENPVDQEGEWYLPTHGLLGWLPQTNSYAGAQELNSLWIHGPKDHGDESY